MKPLRVLSLGAGVQSSALALMMRHDEIEPADLVVFADTGDEPAAVYFWLDWLVKEMRMPFVSVKAGDGYAAAVEAACKTGCRVSTPPLYTSSGGMLARQCTWDYKVMPIRRHVRRILAKGQTCVMVRGISWDEQQRAKPSDVQYIEHDHPLCTLGSQLTRQDCKRWLASKGYPVPPRSACRMCPYRCNAGWAEMRDRSPSDFDQACKWDEMLRRGLPKVKDECYIHKSRVPLREADLSTDIERGQLPLPGFGDCEGMCGI
jgi:3'-phosphoadenosine 5'-phosphosulfate sulfotransferase (PAPS reductase)/FAD synthetase